MKNKIEIITGKKIIFAPSIVKDQNNDVSAFLSERFYSVNKCHNSAIIIGSSLAQQAQDMEHDTILDSSGVLVTKNKLGIVDGARVVVSDGLGGGVGNLEEDEEILKAAQSNCAAFLESDKSIADTLKLISQSISAKPSSVRRDEAQASLAVFTYRYDEKQGYLGDFANIGDGLIIVLDKQFKLKHSLCARHTYRGFGQWAPASLQMLTAANQDNVVAKKSLALDEGDIVVSMTDGIWGELPSSLVSETSISRDIGIDQAAFEALFSALDNSLNPSSFEIAQLITIQAMSESLRRRKILVELIHGIEKQDFQEQVIVTVNDALAYFEKVGEDDLASSFNSILFDQGMNDGIQYFKNVEIPLDLVIKDLKSRSVGDCSTVNVNRVPYHLDELIRCFISHPEKNQALSTLFQTAIKSEDDLKDAFSRLSYEIKQSVIDCKFSEIHFEPVFDKELLNKAEKVLIYYFNATLHTKNTVDYETRLTDLTEYIAQEVSLEKDDLELLLSMLESQIKPKKGFLYTLFNDNQGKLYRQFRKQFELEFSAEKDREPQRTPGALF